jgi:electron-transferring-flavoprotein dehydrogenase
VTDEDVSYLTETKKFKLPVIPPPLNNHGCYVVSLNKLVRCSGRSSRLQESISSRSSR